jgi:uncharacterized protein YlaI
MIITENITFTINSSYQLKYYKNNKFKDTITIPISELPIGSHQKILVSCDICGKEKEMEYRTYLKNINNDENHNYFCIKCAKIKTGKTLNRIYGKSHPSQIEEFRNKKVNTFLENYGLDHPMKSKVVRDKFESTMISKYNVKNALESPMFLEKSRKSNLERYGNENYFSTDICKEKTKKTNLEKYGVENAFQLDITREKFKKTCMEKYGVHYPIQLYEIWSKSFITGLKMKLYENTNIYYQGTYEKDFLDLCKKLNILDKIKRGPSIKFISNNKNYIYHSDFIYNNLIIEIKSDYWFNKHKELNEIKQSESIENGYDFIFIINKKYDKFLKIIN